MNAAERRIVKRIVSKALQGGNSISVYDGEEFAVKRNRAWGAIMAAVGATDEDTLIVHAATGAEVGRILFIYGNDPDEVVADYTDNAYIRSLVGDDEPTQHSETVEYDERPEFPHGEYPNGAEFRQMAEPVIAWPSDAQIQAEAELAADLERAATICEDCMNRMDQCTCETWQADDEDDEPEEDPLHLGEYGFAEQYVGRRPDCAGF